MKIMKKLSQKQIETLFDTGIIPAGSSVYPLQDANQTFYYTVGQKHGFLKTNRVLTDPNYTNFHMAFNVNGIDCYAVAYLADPNFRVNKLELVDLQTGKVVQDNFGAIRHKGHLLAYRVDNEGGCFHSGASWGIFDLKEGKIMVPASYPLAELDKLIEACEKAS